MKIFNPFKSRFYWSKGYCVEKCSEPGDRIELN